jgi:periplasmic protein TonB
VRLYRNHRASESERLTFALLFSLILHMVLLFFVRFTQPSWNGLVNATAPLNVTLEGVPAEIAKPSIVAKASQSSTGKAKIGVQEDKSFPQQPVTATRSVPTEQPNTEIPKAVISKEVMTVKKPANASVPENTPDFLVSQTPPPEKTEAPYAPAPSVEKTETAVTPPAEKLASVEPESGEKQEKIVYAEAAQEKANIEKPGSGTEEPKPLKVEEPAPVPAPAEPAPSQVEKTQPVVTKTPEPLKIEEPAKTEAPASAVLPASPKIEEARIPETQKPELLPEPAKVGESRPEAPQPASAETATAPGEKPSESSRPNAVQENPLPFNIPSLIDLGIAAVRQPANDNGRKIRFGEPRRKTIGMRERDFRYAMYADSVRQKLERIGKFNYPAEAARSNWSGTLSMLISIRADGSLENLEIIQPSGYEVLNAGAEKIVRMADPFAPLPDNIRQETDILTIRLNWSFSASRQSFD